ncbi:GNAT family N-acetyltransferase [Knoellia remsis]|nr:GNAT family N-acetyltransferase [Knoellia remsis]
MAYTTRLLTADTWDAFASLVEAHNGVWGGCWCIGFHADGFQGSPAANRDAKRAHVDAGTVHQVLVFDGQECIGWCQFGSPSELPNIKNRKKYDAAEAPEPSWRIGCIFTASKRRGEGVARAAVEGALAEIARAGGGAVEAYPEQSVDRKPQRGCLLPHRAGGALHAVRLRPGPPDRQVALGHECAGGACMRSVISTEQLALSAPQPGS